MSVREQERREKRALRRADRVEQRIRTKQRQTDERADQIIRKIEKGDVQPRPRPGESGSSSDNVANP